MRGRVPDRNPAFACQVLAPVADQAFDPVLPSRLCRRSRAFVLRAPLSAPGVTVNEGAILGAAVFMLKDVKPWMIVMENTARD